MSKNRCLCALCAYKKVRCENESSKYYKRKVKNDFTCPEGKHGASKKRRKLGFMYYREKN